MKNKISSENFQFSIFKISSSMYLVASATRWRFLYNDHMVSEGKPPHARFEKWQEESDYIPDFDEYLTCMYNSMKETKMKSFVYTFYLWNIMTSRLLYNMAIKATTVCYLCNAHKESLSHLFDRCVVTRHLWEKLKASSVWLGSQRLPWLGIDRPFIPLVIILLGCS